MLIQFKTDDSTLDLRDDPDHIPRIDDSVVMPDGQYYLVQQVEWNIRKSGSDESHIMYVIVTLRKMKYR